MKHEPTLEERHKRLPAIEKTYGEKMHALIFHKLINFWATLAISGLFVFWFKHSTKPLPQTFFGGKLPREFHENFRSWFKNMGFVKTLGRTEHGAGKVGEIMADALSINLPGTLTIFPSAWLGEKYKTRIVEHFDRKHYGVNAEDDPNIAERHRIIEAELKPTLLGAAVSRIGTMVASVGTSFVIGAPDNLVRRMGGNQFPGIDRWAGAAGAAAGKTITQTTPGFSGRVDSLFRKAKVDWTVGPQASDSYRSALEGVMKYTSLDVMYTIVTSSTINPFIRFFNRLPIFSYQQEPRPRLPRAQETPESIAEPLVPIVHTPDDAKQPKPQVSNVTTHETLQPHASMELQT